VVHPGALVGGLICVPAAILQVLKFLFIPRFDIEPCSGRWIKTITRKADMQAAVPKPHHDIPVVIRKRT
jgi:hypothetical protein